MNTESDSGGDDQLELRASGCCSSEDFDVGNGCPCSAILAKHRFAGFIFLGLVALAILIAEVGGVLGILAFFRTI